MENLGTRTIDDLGRVILPKEVRQAKGWKKGDAITFYNINGDIVIKQEEPNEELMQVQCSGLVVDDTVYFI